MDAWFHPERAIPAASRVALRADGRWVFGWPLPVELEEPVRVATPGSRGGGGSRRGGVGGGLFEPGDLSGPRTIGRFEREAAEERQKWTDLFPFPPDFDVPPPPQETPKTERLSLSCEQLQAMLGRYFGLLLHPCPDVNRPDPDEPGPTPLMCPDPVENGEENVVEISGLADGNRAFKPGSGTPALKLILHLHGVANDVDSTGASNVLRAYAQAGYRVLALAWNDDLLRAKDQCVDDPDFNGCLSLERGASLVSIEQEAVATLKSLAATDPAGGWSTFLSGADDESVDWAHVVLSGYSEGAHQASFMSRELAIAGLILISGGGELGTYDGDADDPLADWMSAPTLAPVDRIVGLRHVQELHDYTEGWTLAGMPEDAEIDALGDPPYAAFELSHRMNMSSNVFGDPVLAHTDTVKHVGLFPGHMYLACRAGGAPIP